MNQKEIKEIARIIKSWFNPPLANKLDKENFEGFVNDLASHFEREDNRKFTEIDGMGNVKHLKKLFNKKQFLKDCGCLE